MPVPAEQGSAVRPGQPQERGRSDDVAEPDLLFKCGVERVDRRGGSVIDGVPARALRSLGVNDLVRLDVAAVTVVVGPYRRWRLHLAVSAEWQSLSEGRDEREDFRRGIGLYTSARAVLLVDRVVDRRVARTIAERMIDRDGPDASGVRLKQNFGVGVVARVVIARIRRLHEIDSMISGALIDRAQRRIDPHAAVVVQRGPD